ncbi:antibiotic biosynthesis monooxygenase (plasmid) [Paracoccus pantotrophus]|uniref:Antibiotic biosynthesis monooxygenase n=1 Tax=Paracoccus pantotrophus TaxID=82367 RepID=A0A7H9C0M0_PARPN|nr:putative quinol monooxygenase [Paracoccus pantotrophus]QLH17023.1 antibiotic biosynthesis monooxygenase [Paracoccus pantotrophus]
MSYVVLPSFEVEEDDLQAFLTAARADAAASLANEPGCLQFDIAVDRTASPVRVIFYEVYADRAAFDRHLETPHLAAFRGSLHLCHEGPVQFFERAGP